MQDSIVFLDAGTLNYGDLSFDRFKKLGSLKLYSFTKPSQIASRIRNASIVIVNKCVLNAGDLSKAKSLRAIVVAATGVNNVDKEFVRAYKFSLMNVPGYSTESVVQLTFAFILALAENLIPYHQAVRAGAWSRSQFFSLSNFPITEISGKTLGIVGYGAIGRRVAQVAKAFGMKILISQIPGRKYKTSEKRTPLDAVLRQSDFVSIHAPLSDLTRNLIDRRRIRKMKPSAFLINMARGGIIQESALREALAKRWIAGAASDVLTEEPPSRSHVLLNAPRLILTPHIAWSSLEARRRLVEEIALNIQFFQKGKKRNRIV